MPKILMIGASGFIGQALGVELVRRGYEINLLSRGVVREKLAFPCQIFQWQGDAAELPAAALDGVIGVFNLAGESLADGRWSAARKARFRTSRLGPVAALVQAIRGRELRPSVVVQASAIGYYGDAGDQLLTETSPSGKGFLAKLCVDWEAAAQPLNQLGVRLVCPRIGVVLGQEGGALPQLRRLYQIGAGAAPGNAQQWFSWIALGDLVALLIRALEDSKVHGPINAVAPGAVRYEELHRAFTGRPQGSILKAPRVVMRAAVGEGASMLLASLRVAPAKAEAIGFKFAQPRLESALESLLVSGERRHHGVIKVAQWVPASLETVAAFFADAANLEAITPPWLNFRVRSMSTPLIANGTKIRYRLSLHGVPLRWESLISEWTPPLGFVDEQVLGPFKSWHHRHTFEALAGGTLVTDCVQFKVPLGTVGALTAGFLVAHDVRRIFSYRRAAIARHFGQGQQND